MNDQFSSIGETPVALRRRRPRRAWLVGVLLVIAFAAAATSYWYVTRNTESTDDAYTDGRAVTIAPQVSGQVVSLNVTDNQRVRDGDLLLQIDPRSYGAARDAAAAAVHSAEAQLDAARLNLANARIDYPAKLDAARAALSSAQATQAKAEADAKRQLSLPRGATTQQEIDSAKAVLQSAQAATAQAAAALRQADQVGTFIAAAEAQVKQLEAQASLSRAQLATAELNLSWTRVTAPQDGWITKRNVEKGSYVQAGQSLFSLVTPEVWITANFKESQLDRMRPGQKVQIRIDAYPGLRLIGHVDSVQLGSGARFTAFPPENATGNFVKIVQRVPVKIVIDSGLDPSLPLPLGLSVDPVVQLN